MVGKGPAFGDPKKPSYPLPMRPAPPGGTPSPLGRKAAADPSGGGNRNFSPLAPFVEFFSPQRCPMPVFLLRVGRQLSHEDSAVPGRVVAGKKGGRGRCPLRVAGTGGRRRNPSPPPALESPSRRGTQARVAPPHAGVGPKLGGKNLLRDGANSGLWFPGRSAFFPGTIHRDSCGDPKPPTGSGSVG